MQIITNYYSKKYPFSEGSLDTNTIGQKILFGQPDERQTFMDMLEYHASLGEPQPRKRCG